MLTLTPHPEVPRKRHVEEVGIEPTRQRLQGATAASAVTPKGPPRPGTPRNAHDTWVDCPGAAASRQLRLACRGGGPERPAGLVLTLWSSQQSSLFEEARRDGRIRTRTMRLWRPLFCR